MPQVDRHRPQEMNLDSLTDVVTNLAGTLILVVVLVLGVTRSASYDGGHSPAGERSLSALLRQIESLRCELAELDRAAHRAKARLTEYRERMARGAPGPEGKSTPQRKPSGSTSPSGVGWTHGADRLVQRFRGFEKIAIGTSRPAHLSGLCGAGSEPVPFVQNLFPVRPLLAAGCLLAIELGPTRVAEPRPSDRSEYAARLAREGLNTAGAQATDLDRRWAEVLRELNELEDLLAHPPAKDEPNKSAAEGVQKVWFRPPLARRTPKQPIGVVCENGRFSLLDFPALNDRLANLLPKLSTPRAGQRVPFSLNDSDFRFELVTEEARVTVQGKQVSRLRQYVEAVRKAGHPGQTWEELSHSDSWFQQALARANPDQSFVSFAVWPDSFEAFRRARAVAWERQFEVGWEPQEAGQALRLGAGPGIVL